MAHEAGTGGLSSLGGWFGLSVSVSVFLCGAPELGAFFAFT